MFQEDFFAEFGMSLLFVHDTSTVQISCLLWVHLARVRCVETNISSESKPRFYSLIDYLCVQRNKV